ncbi:hypothetical protein EAF04_002485 [Stromatinia cepivora]|nr:hypothetical protein EAF04_002485 [Stromatinia cepivora]
MSTSSKSGVDPAPASFEIRDRTKSIHQKSDNIKGNHNEAAPTSTTDGENNDNLPKDDPATMAASEELKHTTISDKLPLPTETSSKVPEAETHTEDKNMSGTDKDTTPEAESTDAQDEEMRDRISSPKKKRGRDQDDDPNQLEDNSTINNGSISEGSLNGSRTMRSGPEKKRPRDTSQEPSRISDRSLAKEISPAETSKTTQTSTSSTENPIKSIFGSTSGDKFANSGFGALASSSTSPFGTIGASKPSVFGGNTKSPLSGFGALASKPTSSTPTSSTLGTSGEKTTSGFGSAFSGGSTSGFGGLGSGSVFGSGLKNGFAGGSGPKLSSFAAPGNDNVALGSKPVKPFGAPASDAEDSDDDEDDSEGGAEGDEEEGGEKAVVEEKRKPKKVHIDDGEAEEATILQIRSKLFAMGSKEAGWKERGVGTLKINAPKSCVDLDENGHVIPGSFDSSMLEGHSVRLVMRQENTHRVILNTVVLKAMEFKPKPSTTSAQVLFTAFEGETEAKPINMILKMNENNYNLFINEIENIQHEL